jgi:hypothetical protein
MDVEKEEKFHSDCGRRRRYATPDSVALNITFAWRGDMNAACGIRMGARL